MSTTRPYPPGDRGPEPGGAGASAAAAGCRHARAAPGPPAAPGGRQRRRARWPATSPAQALHDWGWLPAATADQRAAAEDVLLVVSELVTNACLHAEGPEELRIALRQQGAPPGGLRPRRGLSPRRAPRTAPGRPGGHGMFIVQRLCLDWGVVRNAEGAGKTVWAELAAPVLKGAAASEEC